MGKAYNMTVQEAVEFVVDIGKSSIHSRTGPTDSHWFLLYKEAIDMLDMALRTKGQCIHEFGIYEQMGRTPPSPECMYCGMPEPVPERTRAEKQCALLGHRWSYSDPIHCLRCKQDLPRWMI